MPVVDSTTLLYFLNPNTRPPQDPETREPVSNPGGRVAFLFDLIESQNGTIFVPAPVLGEVLAYAEEDSSKYLDMLDNRSCFEVVSFDRQAAIDFANMSYETPRFRRFRIGTQESRAKIKFDRQIIAITRTLGETTIYSDDKGIASFSNEFGLTVIATHELPLPPKGGSS